MVGAECVQSDEHPLGDALSELNAGLIVNYPSIQPANTT